MQSFNFLWVFVAIVSFASNQRMAQKETINVNTHPAIAKQFRELAKNYDGRIGMCLSAAMVMFMQADPEAQGDFLKRVFEAQIRDEVESLLQKIRDEQIKNLKLSERKDKDASRRTLA